MRRACAVLHTGMVLAALAGASWQLTAAQPALRLPEGAPPHFRSAVTLTTVTATVTDAAGRLVHDLPREQFQAFEDGRPQVITQFTSARVPVSVGILLDTSDSMYGRRMTEAREAIESFLSERLDPADEYALIVFNHRQQLLSAWTDDRLAAPRLLASVHPWGATAVYDALLAAIPLADTRHRQRAALLVISDGADTASDAAQRDVRAALLRSDVFVYAIAIDAADRRAINAPVNAATLAAMTDPSGGATRVVHDASEVRLALQQIAEELNSQYLIGYSSTHPADGAYHSIRLRVSGGSYHVRARAGYIDN